MKKNIGIVITNVSKREIEGFLCKTDIYVKTCDDGTLKVAEDIFKTFFIYNIETEVLKLKSIADWETSKEVAFELWKIVDFKEVNLEYDGNLYHIDSDFELHMI